MERSKEDITIYSAQCVYTAWHPPAFQASILPVQRGGFSLRRPQRASVAPMGAALVAGVQALLEIAHLPSRFLLLLFTLKYLPLCPKSQQVVLPA